MQRYEKKLRYASSEGGNCVEYAFCMHLTNAYIGHCYSLCAPQVPMSKIGE